MNPAHHPRLRRRMVWSNSTRTRGKKAKRKYAGAKAMRSRLWMSPAPARRPEVSHSTATATTPAAKRRLRRAKYAANTYIDTHNIGMRKTVNPDADPHRLGAKTDI